MKATIAYRFPIGPCWSFIKVAPTAALRELLMRRYRALGWEYFTSFKDVNGYGLSAARYAGPDPQPQTVSPTKAPRYRLGTTSRITVTSVHEDVCDITADTPENLHKFWVQIIAKQADYEPDKESVVVVMMNTRLRPYAWHRVSLGTVNECPACPREIFRPVIAAAAYGFALMHNHPSGDPSPSRSDESTTRRIVEAAGLLQIRFVDHVVVGEPSPGRSPYYSFREAGYIP